MATKQQQENAINSAKGRPLSRIPYYEQAKHFNDDFLNLGYDYRGKLLKKTTSPQLWANPLQTSLYGRIEGMLTLVLEQVKSNPDDEDAAITLYKLGVATRNIPSLLDEYRAEVPKEKDIKETVEESVEEVEEEKGDGRIDLKFLGKTIARPKLFSSGG